MSFIRNFLKFWIFVFGREVMLRLPELFGKSCCNNGQKFLEKKIHLMIRSEKCLVTRVATDNNSNSFYNRSCLFISNLTMTAGDVYVTLNTSDVTFFLIYFYQIKLNMSWLHYFRHFETDMLQLYIVFLKKECVDAVIMSQ